MRYRSTFPQDDVQSRDGDSHFIGMDMRRDPSQLPPGLAAELRNKRCLNGVAGPRRGILQLGWGNRFGAWFPLVFPIDFEQILPFGQVHAAAVFDDPDDQKWIVIAADGKAYVTRESNTAREIPLPTGVVLAEPIFFVQAVERLIMFRGPSLAPLEMTNVDDGFTTVTQVSSGAGNGTGTLVIPNSSYALAFQNRVLVIVGRDEVAWSDILNYTRYSILNQGRINKGSADPLVGIYPWNDTTVIVAKQSSIYAISGLVPDASGNWAGAQLDVITTAWGIVAAESMIAVGNDLVGLSQRGLVSITQTEQNKLQAVDVPLSEPIQPLIDRINWRYASRAKTAFWQNKIYLAVPIDDAEVVGNELRPITATYATDLGGGEGSILISNLIAGRTYRYTQLTDGDYRLINGSTTYEEDADFVAETTEVTMVGFFPTGANASLKPVWKGVNNAVLVYNTLNKAWESLDSSERLMVKQWFLFEYAGEERLFFVSDDGFINLYEEGNEDGYLEEEALQHSSAQAVATYATVQAGISDYLLSRGYLVGALDQKNFRRVTANVKTWAPKFSIRLKTDGHNEFASLVTDRQKSRTRYYSHAKAAWDSTNVNLDHGNPYREDYSVAPTNSQGGDIQLDDVGNLVGVNFDAHQESTEKLRTNVRGKYAQIEVTNTEGRCEIMSLEVLAAAGPRREGVLV